MIAQTARLLIRKLTTDDAGFILQILNDPLFIQHVGDKHVRTLDDACHYIEKVPLASYERYGFGHYLVELKATSEPIGICSLVKRDWLEDVDLGFAFLPAFRRLGYAAEAASAVLAYAHGTLGLKRLVAIVSPENAASIGLLQKLGMVSEGTVQPADDRMSLRLFAEPRSAGADSQDRNGARLPQGRPL